MSEKLSMYVLTDTHYLSRAMWEEGDNIDGREMGDQIAIKCTPEILRTFFRKITEDKDCEYVLITGDLINNGDRQSHIDFIKELDILTQAGKKVLVTCATHDYAGLGDDENIFHAVYYGKETNTEAERVYKTELPSLYYDFGHKHARNIHEESGSYTINLSKEITLIAIYDNGNGRSHCGLFEDGFKWLENEIDNAKKNGETVFLAVHHPVIPPWNIYKDIAEFELFGGYERLRRLMCEKDVKLIFTGHTHIHGIKKYEDEQGRYFYDVTTTALPTANGRMRKVVFDKDTRVCDISSVGIDVIDGLDTGGLSAREYVYGLNFVGLLEKSLPLMKTDWNLFVDNVSHVVNIGKFRKHPHAVRFAVNSFCGMKMSVPARFSKKISGITKEEIKYLKNVTAGETAFRVLRCVLSGNGPFPPETPEYKVITGTVIKAERLLKKFRYDINSLLPGKDTVLEIIIPFLYNNRTGNDDEIIIEMEK